MRHLWIFWVCISYRPSKWGYSMNLWQLELRGQKKKKKKVLGSKHIFGSSIYIESSWSHDGRCSLPEGVCKLERGPTFVTEDEPRRETEQKPSEMQVRNQKCVVSCKSVRKQYQEKKAVFSIAECYRETKFNKRLKCNCMTGEMWREKMLYCWP